MTDIILFRPSVNTIATHRCPLGLVYLATPLVTKGMTVKIIDEEITPDWMNELKNNLNSSTICVGLSVMTGESIRSALKFSKAVKEMSEVPVIWGGIHPSLLPDETIQNEFIDIIVIGEGDKKFSEIVDCIVDGKSLKDTKSIVYKENKEIHHTEKENFLDMNQLPIPNYKLIDVEYYKKANKSFFGGTKGYLDLNVDRGCPFRCGFCYNIKFNERKWRAINAEKILDTIEILIKEYNVDAINFVSDNFFVNRSRVLTLCQGLIDRNINITWHADIRIDEFLRYDDNTILLMKKSGCYAMTFGVESGSDRILKLINKDITTEDVLKAHNRAMSFGFTINYHFMIGFPDETKDDMMKTIKLAIMLCRNKNCSIYGPSVYTPYPGTPLFDRCCELGFIPPHCLEDWIYYDWDKTPNLPWFGKDLKNFMMDVVSLCEPAFSLRLRNNPFLSIASSYFNLRLKGLEYGIHSSIDIKMMKLARRLFFETNK